MAVLGALAVNGLFVASRLVRFLPLFGWVATLMWVVGWVTFGLVTMMGAGALLRSKFGQGPGGRWWPPFAPVLPAAPASSSATPVAPASGMQAAPSSAASGATASGMPPAGGAATDPMPPPVEPGPTP